MSSKLSITSKEQELPQGDLIYGEDNLMIADLGSFSAALDSLFNNSKAYEDLQLLSILDALNQLILNHMEKVVKDEQQQLQEMMTKKRTQMSHPDLRIILFGLENMIKMVRVNLPRV